MRWILDKLLINGYIIYRSDIISSLEGHDEVKFPKRSSQSAFLIFPEGDGG